MPLLWMPKRGSKKGDKIVGAAREKQKQQKYQKQQQRKQEGQDRDVKLHYLNSLSNLLGKKKQELLVREETIQTDSASSRESRNLYVDSKSSRLGVGERLKTWYKSSSQSSDQSSEGEASVANQESGLQKQEDTSTESVLGISEFLDFSKFHDQQQTPYNKQISTS